MRRPATASKGSKSKKSKKARTKRPAPKSKLASKPKSASQSKSKRPQARSTRASIPDPHKTAPSNRTATLALAHRANIPAPRVTAPRPLGPPANAGLANRGQDIESAFEAWQELREHHRAALERLSDERKALGQQGDFVMGAVRAARQDGQGEEGLAPRSGLDAFVTDAATKLEQAKRELDEAAEKSRLKWDEQFAKMRAEVRARIERTLEHVKPKVHLRLRTLPGDRRILHIDRPGPDESVLLCVLLTDKLPSRYEFLFDDAMDNLSQMPASLYPDEGITPANVRPDPAAIDALLSRADEVMPLKAMLLMRVGPALVRLVERGPVMEAEIADGASFRNVLTRDEAEKIAGHLLKLKLEGRVELDLATD